MQACFVIPIYNHPQHIAALLDYMQQFSLPMIVVNDGSDAECSALLKQLAEHYPLLDLLQHPTNLGKGQAVITGLRHAHARQLTHALQIDADGQHDWQDIARFLQAAQQHPAAMVIGQPLFDASVPRKRLYGRYLTHVWVWINSLSFEIKDSMCGFRVYPLAQTMPILERAKFQPRMGFDSEILVRMSWENVSMLNIPTKVTYPDLGVSHFHVWRDNWGMSQAHGRLLAGMLCRLPQLLAQKIKPSQTQAKHD